MIIDTAADPEAFMLLAFKESVFFFLSLYMVVFLLLHPELWPTLSEVFIVSPLFTLFTYYLLFIDQRINII